MLIIINSKGMIFSSLPQINAYENMKGEFCLSSDAIGTVIEKYKTAQQAGMALDSIGKFIKNNPNAKNWIYDLKTDSALTMGKFLVAPVIAKMEVSRQ